jgi:hypothetical protein
MVKRSGKLLGSVLELNLIAAGVIIGGVAILAGRRNFGRKVQRTGKKLGKFVGRAAKISTSAAGIFMEAASSESVRLGKAIAENVYKSKVRVYGDASAFYDKDKIIKADITDVK